MPKTVGKLKEGTLSISGKIDERVPVITNGLVAHYPFDGTDLPIQTFSADLSSAKTSTSEDLFIPLDRPTFSPTEGVTLTGASSNYIRTNRFSDLTIVNSTDGLDVEIEISPKLYANMAIVSQYSSYSSASRRTFTIRLQSSGKIYVEVGTWQKQPIPPASKNEPSPVTGWGINTTSARTVPINEWSRIRLTYDQNKLRLYINDVLESEVSALPDIDINGIMYSQRVFADKNDQAIWIGADGASLNTTDSRVTNPSNDPEALVPGWTGVANFNGSLRNLRISRTAPPMHNSNNTLTPDGIGVDEGTTNILTDASMLNATNRASFVGVYGPTTYQIVDDCFIAGTKSQRMYRTGTGNTGEMMNAGMSFFFNTIAGESITVSFYGRGWDEQLPISFYSTQLSGGKVVEARDVGNGWTRYVYTAKATTTSCTLFIRPNGNMLYDFDCLMNAPQIEKKPLATSFVDGNRSPGELRIPMPTGPDFTIFYRFRPDVFWSDTNPSGYTSKYIWYLHDALTGKKIWMADYFTSGQIRSGPWIGHDEFVTNSYSGWHWHYNYLKWYMGKEYWFALTKNGNVVTKYLIDEDGYKSQTLTHTNAELIAFSPKELQFSSQYNAVYRDLAIYNRALSEEEIKKIGKTGLSITKEGDIVGSVVTEKNPSIPVDAVHVPLDDNSSDRFKRLSPSAETSTMYEDNSVWVGTTHSNLVNYPEFSETQLGGKWGSWDSSTLTFSKVGVGGRITNAVNILKRSSGENNAIHQPISGLTVGKQYTLSFYARLHPDSTVDKGSFRGYIRSYESYPVTKEWQRINITQDATATSHTIHLTQDSVNYIVQVAMVQLQGQPFTSPFTPDSNSRSKLEFNLNRDYGLKWNEDWTIIYWKKPIGTSTDLLTGYNIESLGCNANTVGGGYFWVGKESGSNSSLRPNYNIDPSMYFGTWQMVVLRRTGGVNYYENYSPLGVFKSTAAVAITKEDYYVTQHGYDIKLGGWDSVNASNTYFKDLIAVKRFLTDAEIEAIYKTKLSSKKGELFIPNKIKEGYIL